MSLMKTLAKVAIGVAVAKGVSGMVANQKAGNPGSGSVFGDRARTGSGQDIGLEDLLGGGAPDRTARGGATPGGGIGDLLGQILAGGGAAAGTQRGGGLGGMLDGLSEASRPGNRVERPKTGSLGDLLNQSLERYDEPEADPTPDQEEAAELLLRAMLQAAKSDGRIDEKEKEKLLGQLGDVSRHEMAFINEELGKPVDVKGLAREIPQSMAQQAYFMSLMAIDLDNRNEAKYLHEFAQALGISQQQANMIHERLGAPSLYG